MQFRFAEIALVAALLAGVSADEVTKKKIQITNISCLQWDDRVLYGSVQLTQDRLHYGKYLHEGEESRVATWDLERPWLSVDPDTDVQLTISLATPDHVELLSRKKTLTASDCDDGHVRVRSRKNKLWCDIHYTVEDHIR
eukprot:Clim_evm3s205 gene=Clim_evmTU3s205